MNIIYDRNRLLALLDSFSVLIDIKITLFDQLPMETFTQKGKHPFCAAIQATKEGTSRCISCDKNASEIAHSSKKTHVYRCHAGLIEACFPVVENGIVIAYLMFGQILDDTPIETQWAKTKELCAWYEDIDSLRDIYFSLVQISHQKITACANILSACTAYIWLSELVKSSEPNHMQRILSYIDANYSSKITLDNMSIALSLSKTTLCCVAKNQFGKSISELIRQKRVSVAKSYLETTDMLISDVAEKVGISDVNYFTKVFKTETGGSPSNYQKTFRKKKLQS